MNTKHLELRSLFPLLTITLSLFFASQPIASAQTVTWLEPDAVWKYFANSSEPPLDGSNNWKDLDYDDSSWPSGPAQLGFGNSPTTEVPRVPQGITYYFRNTLNVTNDEMNDANQIVFNLLRDDGAVVYINGEEVFRDNMPGDVDDPVEYETLALGAVGGNDERAFQNFSAFSEDFLRVGDNLIAVEVHQSNSGSSDIGFALEMLGFQIVPRLGPAVPPAPIDFGTFFSGPRPSEDRWNQLDRLAGDPFRLGFFTENSNAVSAFVGEGIPSTNMRFRGGEQAYVLQNGSADITTELVGTTEFNDLDFFPGAYRVDVSNFKDVRVQFDLRAFDSSGGGMPANSRARFSLLTSTLGVDPVEEQLLDLSGALIAPGSGSTEVLISDEDTKRVIVPDANTSASGDWTQLSFNDSSWIEGVSGAGYDTNTTYDRFFGPTLDLQSQMLNKQTSLYMRIPFTVTDASAFTNLILNMRYDDGFVAYLNGTRVASSNAPSGTPAFDAAATDQNKDPDAVVPESFSLSVNLSDLQDGANILAIHGLNVTASSSDMLTGVELIATLPGNANGGEPETLTDISSTDPDGPFHTFSYDVSDNVNSVSMEWRLTTPNNTSNAIILDNVLVSGTPISVNSYATWIALNTDFQIDDLGAPNADPDGDLVPNLIEYAFGGSATEPNVDYGPEFGIVEIDGEQHVSISWPQLNLTTTGGLDGRVTPEFLDIGDIFGGFKVRDLIYVPEISSDGLVWEEATQNNTIATLLNPFPETDDELVQIDAYFVEPIRLRDNPDRVFVRIRVYLDAQ